MKRLILILAIFAFSLTGCGLIHRDNINGKFAFISTRNATPEKPVSSLYILKDSKLKRISEQYGSPKWNKSGNRLYCKSKDDICILNDNGEQIKFIKTPYRPVSIDVSSDEKIIVYSVKEATEQKRMAYLYIYDAQTDEHKKIEIQEDLFSIDDLHLSNNNKRILFVGNAAFLKKANVYMIDIDGKNFHIFWDSAPMASWFPDDKHILIKTTQKRDGGPICNAFFGALIKVDAETMRYEIVREVTSFITYIELSRDGKYIYYSKPYEKGSYVVLSPLNNSKKEIQITKPVRKVTSKGVDLGYSQDFAADWHQGN